MPDTLAVAVAAQDTERCKILSDSLRAAAAKTIIAGDYSKTVAAFRDYSFDALVVDLDGNQEDALALIEHVAASHPEVPIVVCSSGKDAMLAVKAMRAGAREYLAFPPEPRQLAEALAAPAATPRSASAVSKSQAPKIFAFWGSKGGVGTTTLATNFAIALREESGEPVALGDLSLHLGDVGVSLGLEPKFSMQDALKSIDRMDRDFLKAIMVEHSSGVSVLPGPDEFASLQTIPNGDFTSLLDVMTKGFPYVVLDGGPASSYLMHHTFSRANRVYLVVSADIASARNAKRLIAFTEAQKGRVPEIELVLNRSRSKNGMDEASVARTLEPHKVWRVPNDYQRVLESLNRGVSLFETRSPILPVLRDMARQACGKPEPVRRSSAWGFLTGSGKK